MKKGVLRQILGVDWADPYRGGSDPRLRSPPWLLVACPSSAYMYQLAHQPPLATLVRAKSQRPSRCKHSDARA